MPEIDHGSVEKAKHIYDMSQIETIQTRPFLLYRNNFTIDTKNLHDWDTFSQVFSCNFFIHSLIHNSIVSAKRFRESEFPIKQISIFVVNFFFRDLDW